MSTPAELTAFKNALLDRLALALDYDTIVNQLEELREFSPQQITLLRNRRSTWRPIYSNYIVKKFGEFWVSCFLGDIVADLKQRLE